MDYTKIEGTVFNIQRYSIDDGPGVRTTVFVKGCPLKCKWCSNPESQSMEKQLRYRFTSCKKCGTCVKVCPNGAITMGEDGVIIDREKCQLCGTCVKKCLLEALSFAGETITVEKAFKTVRRDKDYYDQGGGGCTCSGGEILMQPDFVAGIFRMCRENGIHTNADTCGLGSREALEKIMEYADMFYYDLKHMDPVEHEKGTGVDNKIILENLKLIAERGIPTVIRVPVIPGYNDSDENITALAKTVKEIIPYAPINLLPYHKYGASKYKMLGKEYELEDLEPLSQEREDRIVEIIKSFGIECKVSK